MTQQSILHLVVDWEVFTINIISTANSCHSIRTIYLGVQGNIMKKRHR